MDLNWLISVDDHILEPPNVWQDRVPAKPRTPPPASSGTTGEGWVYEDKRIPTSGLSAVVGKEKEEFSPDPVTYDEMRPGCYDPVARLEDMDRAGILASLCFPSFPRFCGQLFKEADDRDLALACLQAYNDWLIEEWCGAAPGRYIPLMLIPMWDPPAAAEEMERMRGQGRHGCRLLGEPRTARPADHPRRGPLLGPRDRRRGRRRHGVCMHVGSSSNIPTISADAPPSPTSPGVAAAAPAARCSTGSSARTSPTHPDLKIALSEGEHRLDALLPRAGRAGARQAALLGLASDQ